MQYTIYTKVPFIYKKKKKFTALQWHMSRGGI